MECDSKCGRGQQGRQAWIPAAFQRQQRGWDGCVGLLLLLSPTEHTKPQTHKTTAHCFPSVLSHERKLQGNTCTLWSKLTYMVCKIISSLIVSHISCDCIMSWFRYFPSIDRTILIIVISNNNNNYDHDKDHLLENKTITVMGEGSIPRRLLCLHCCLNIYALSWEVLRPVGSVFDKIYYFKNWMFDISLAL